MTKYLRSNNEKAIKLHPCNKDYISPYQRVRKFHKCSKQWSKIYHGRALCSERWRPRSRWKKSWSWWHQWRHRLHRWTSWPVHERTFIAQLITLQPSITFQPPHPSSTYISKHALYLHLRHFL